MTRTELEAYIYETYGIEKDLPWISHPNYAVFRHENNLKWFAVIMDIQKSRLGLSGNDIFDVVNLKCDPILIGSLRSEPGFFPAYHMNKEKWITISLDGSVPDDKLKLLLDLSFEMTSPKTKKRKA